MSPPTRSSEQLQLLKLNQVLSLAVGNGVLHKEHAKLKETLAYGLDQALQQVAEVGFESLVAGQAQLSSKSRSPPRRDSFFCLESINYEGSLDQTQHGDEWGSDLYESPGPKTAPPFGASTLNAGAQ
jgi:hypothetical protein